MESINERKKFGILVFLKILTLFENIPIKIAAPKKTFIIKLTEKRNNPMIESKAVRSLKTGNDGVFNIAIFGFKRFIEISQR